MTFKKYHRRYPESGWDYKAISTIFDEKEIIYYTLIDRRKKSTGVEIYYGSNYIVNSSARSYSRRYNVGSVPLKYKQIVSALIKIHKATIWSKAKRVNYN